MRGGVDCATKLFLVSGFRVKQLKINFLAVFLLEWFALVFLSLSGGVLSRASNNNEFWICVKM
ncbi:hypothetical protein SPHINGO8BC_110249 [Sphingobacterium multivorum]|uniref:Uncharacterized protein n=1 Tax=Sphingobacterium multivorum TaxID=28454 RepID=A0A653YPZ6_SPHMU|nr:hypothetical protein SPHINGO8BC_110249 [Sphingobacterium multivorum]